MFMNKHALTPYTAVLHIHIVIQYNNSRHDHDIWHYTCTTYKVRVIFSWNLVL